MGLPIKLPPPAFEELDVARKLEYIDRIYELVGGQEAGHVTDWQATILEERLAAHQSNPNDATPWQESIERARASLRKSRG